MADSETAYDSCSYESSISRFQSDLDLDPAFEPILMESLPDLRVGDRMIPSSRSSLDEVAIDATQGTLYAVVTTEQYNWEIGTYEAQSRNVRQWDASGTSVADPSPLAELLAVNSVEDTVGLHMCAVDGTLVAAALVDEGTAGITVRLVASSGGSYRRWDWGSSQGIGLEVRDIAIASTGDAYVVGSTTDAFEGMDLGEGVTRSGWITHLLVGHH